MRPAAASTSRPCGARRASGSRPSSWRHRRRQLVADLSIGQRQVVAIVKALSYASRVLIMDEPTAALTAGEVERLFDDHARLARERRRHRLHLAPAGGSAADRRPGHGDARRPCRRHHRAATRRRRELVRCWSAARSTSSIPPRAATSGRRCCACDDAALPRRDRRRRLAGAARRLARRPRRRDRRPRRASWAPGAPSF